MSAFSRIALASALIEYDNDPDNPEAPFHRAADSAIFAYLRQTGPIPRPESVLAYEDLPFPRKSTDYLHVALPDDDGSLLMSPTEDKFGGDSRTRPSYDARRSLDILREQGEQYFEGSQESDRESEESEVDLTSWGLDSLMPPKSRSKDNYAKKPGPGKRRPASEHLDHLPNPHSPQSEVMNEYEAGPSFARPVGQRPSAYRSFSMGADQGLNDGFLSFAAGHDTAGRRHTLVLPSSDDPSLQRRPLTSAPVVRPHSTAGIIPTLPFPTSLSPASSPQLPTESGAAEPNPFALPPPDPNRMSKFDPKAAQLSRRLSGSSWISESNFEGGVDRAAQSRARTQSNVSMGSRAFFEGEESHSVGTAARQSHYAESVDPRRMSRLELMRPKVLVMPSPLRDSDQTPDTDPRLRSAGFEVSTGDRPLPANFRTSVAPPRPGIRPLGSSGGLTPNPRLNLSASQLLFRNSLMTGGQRDVSYVDVDKGIRRAQEDGEQIKDEDEEDAVGEGIPRPRLVARSLMDDLEARKKEIKGKQRVFVGDNRPSMMDRGLTRSNTLIDPSTLKMPQVQVMDGQGRPVLEGTQRVSDREKRASGMPLISLDANGGLSPDSANARPTGRLTQSRSVFGTDQVWQRELARLKRMEEAEQAAADKNAREEEAKRGKKGGKKKGKQDSPNLGSASPSSPSGEAATSENPASSHNSLLAPPILPEVGLVSSRGRPRKPHSPDFTDDEGHGAVERRRASMATLGAKGWFAGSSDDEDGGQALSRDHTGSFASPNPRPTPSHLMRNVSDDEDEDIPLAAHIGKVRASVGPQLFYQPGAADDSDEDEPLAAILESKSKTRLSTAPSATLGDSSVTAENPLSLSIPDLSSADQPKDTETDAKKEGLDTGDTAPQEPNTSTISAANPVADSDDDDVPLGLKASQSVLAQQRNQSADDEDEDEKPLGLRFNPANTFSPLGPPTSTDLLQQQQQQYQAMLQQQQQQQMYMQTMAAHTSMANFSAIGGGPPMMGGPPTPFGVPLAGQMTGPFGASMSMLPVPTGMSMGMMPNPEDAAKIARLDAWRKSVS